MRLILMSLMWLICVSIFAYSLPLTLSEQVQEADYILKGRIESKETVFTGKAKFVCTRYKLMVKKDLLGTYPKSELYFELAGGDDGEKKYRVSDVPMLEVGEESIFLLYKPEKKYFSAIVGTMQGRYTLQEDSATGAQLVLDASRKPMRDEQDNFISFASFQSQLEKDIPVYRNQPRTFFPPDPNGNPNNLRQEDMKQWDGSDKRGRVSLAMDPSSEDSFDFGPQVQQRNFIDPAENFDSASASNDDRYVYSEYGFIWEDPPTVFNQLRSVYPILGLRDQAMMSNWNKYIKLYKVRSEPTGTYGYPDFENDICGFVNNTSMYDVFDRNWDPSELAVCFSWGVYHLWEADIACNPAYTFTTEQSWIFSGIAQGVDNTFLHELGHAWGAGHPFHELSVMNYYQDEFRAYSVLYYNDVEALRYKYENDIAIHNLGIYGHYSNGSYQRFEPAYSDNVVTPGSALHIHQVTVENTGTYDMPLTVDVFLTPYPCSWVGAIYLTTLNMGTFLVDTSTVLANITVNVPLTVTPGYYRVAFRIITGGDQIGYDNATWINNRVLVTAPPVPGLWVGGHSPNWHYAANWSGNFIPDSTTDVRIPAGCLHNPLIVQSEGYCRNITIDAGAVLSFQYNSTFFGNMVINGTVLFGNPIIAPDVTILGGVEIRDSGSLSFDSAGGILRVAGSWTEHANSSMSMQPNGTLQFIGDGTSTIVIQSTNSHFYNLEAMKNATGTVIFSNASTSPVYIHGQFLIGSANNVLCQSDYDMYLYGNLACPSDSYFEAMNGTIHMLGMGGAIQLSNTSSINSLNLNAAGTVSLYSNLSLNGNLTISSGSFNAGYHNISLKGSWRNNVGVDAFIEQTSTVIFNGDDDQNLYSENFYGLTVNNPIGRIMMRPGSTINAQIYSMIAGEVLVQGAVFNAMDLANNGIWGNYRVESGEVNLHQDSSSLIDINGNWTLYDGTVRIYGGSTSCWLAGNGNASLNMYGGVFDVVDQGIYINNTGYTFTENITGGTIRTSGSFIVGRADFSPNNNIVELYGSGDAYVGTVEGSALHHLIINKSSREGEAIRSNTIIGFDRLAVLGNLMISAGVFTAPPIIYLGGNWANLVGPDAFVEGSGVVVFQGSDHQYISTENFNTIQLAKSSGALRVQTAIVNCNSYEWYAGAIDLILGNFTALDLGQNGIYGTFYVNILSTLTLHQDASNWVDLNGTLNMLGGECHIYGGNVTSWWGYSNPATVNMSAGLIYFHDQGIEIPNSVNLNISGGTIRTDGGFLLNKENYQGSNWTLELTGSTDAGLWVNASSYLCNLTINKIASRTTAVPMRNRDGSLQNTRSNSIYANTNLQISGNVSITNGSLYAPAQMIVHGDWLSNAYPGGFVHNDGTVVFSGVQMSTIINATGFYSCNINKAIDENTAILILPDAALNIQNLTIMDGLVAVSSGSYLAVGNCIISSGAGLNLLGDDVVFVLLGDFTNYNSINSQVVGFFAGTSNIIAEGLTDQNFVNQSPIELYTLTVSSSAGTLFRPNTQLTIHDLIIDTGAFASTASLSHTITGDFTVYNGQWLDHASTLYLTGSQDQILRMYPTLSNPDDVWFNNIVINKASGTVFIVDSPLHLRNQGNLNIVQGILNLTNQELYTIGVISVGNGSILQVDSGAEVHIGSALEVLSGGSIEISGTNEIPALVTHNETGYPSFAVGSGATISASYGIFEYLSGSGVNIMAGALVNSSNAFNYCTFRNGYENGTLLTLNDSNGYTITGASFPENTWNSATNVTKTVEEGEVFFSQVIGSFAGPAFENDAYNRIQWNDFKAELVITQAAWSAATAEIGSSVTLTATIKNEGVIASGQFYLDLIHNLSLAPEYGITADNSILVASISPDDSVTVSFEDIIWGVSELWQSWLIADASQTVAEFDEDNNISGPYQLSWEEIPMPNLYISGLQWSASSSLVGGEVDITVAITNSSTIPVPDPIDIDLYYNPGTTPDGTVAGDATYTLLTGIGSEATVYHTFTGISSEIVQDWYAFAIINRSYTLEESDYTDNILASSAFSWLALPVVSDLQISHDAIQNQINLNWVYAESVSGFNIYSSTTPDGSTWTHVGFTATNSYQTPVTDATLFYHVRAVNSPTRLAKP